MEQQNKDIILYRILSGINIISIDNITYHIKTPSRIVKYQAAIFYDELYQDNLFGEWMTREEAEYYLVKMSVLPSAYKEEITKLNTQIDDLKVEAFKHVFQFAKLKLFRKKLTEQKNTLQKLSNDANLIDRFTLEGYCDIHKYQYMINNCIYDDKDNKMIVEQKQLEKIIGKIAESTISITDYREMSRTEPWRSYWNAYKEDIFGLPGADLNEEQKTIILFSKMYDNAYKHPECPSEMILSDDDLFDGWSISEMRKNEQDKKKKDIGDDKFGNAGEVFIMANNEKEARKVYQNNDMEAKMIIKQRQEALSKSGKLKEADLPDVRSELNMQANRLMKEGLKRR